MPIVHDCPETGCSVRANRRHASERTHTTVNDTVLFVTVTFLMELTLTHCGSGRVATESDSHPPNSIDAITRTEGILIALSVTSAMRRTHFGYLPLPLKKRKSARSCGNVRMQRTWSNIGRSWGRFKQTVKGKERIDVMSETICLDYNGRLGQTSGLAAW